MSKNAFFLLIAASLSILVTVPGRFACGLILVVLLHLLLLFGVLAREGLNRLGYGRLSHLLVLIVLAGITIFFKQLLYVFSPVTAVTMSFSLYIVCFSSFVAGTVFVENGKILSVQLKDNFKAGAFFSLFALLFFLVRDFLGFGTITFPSRTGYTEIRFIQSFSGAFFWRTIPGAFVLLVLALVVRKYIKTPEDNE